MNLKLLFTAKLRVSFCAAILFPVKTVKTSTRKYTQAYHAVQFAQLFGYKLDIGLQAFGAHGNGNRPSRSYSQHAFKIFCGWYDPGKPDGLHFEYGVHCRMDDDAGHYTLQRHEKLPALFFTGHAQ